MKKALKKRAVSHTSDLVDDYPVHFHLCHCCSHLNESSRDIERCHRCGIRLGYPADYYRLTNIEIELDGLEDEVDSWDSDSQTAINPLSGDSCHLVKEEEDEREETTYDELEENGYDQPSEIPRLTGLFVIWE